MATELEKKRFRVREILALMGAVCIFGGAVVLVVASLIASENFLVDKAQDVLLIGMGPAMAVIGYFKGKDELKIDPVLSSLSSSLDEWKQMVSVGQADDEISDESVAGLRANINRLLAAIRKDECTRPFFKETVPTDFRHRQQG